MKYTRVCGGCMKRRRSCSLSHRATVLCGAEGLVLGRLEELLEAVEPRVAVLPPERLLGIASTVDRDAGWVEEDFAATATLM